MKSYSKIFTIVVLTSFLLFGIVSATNKCTPGRCVTCKAITPKELACIECYESMPFATTEEDKITYCNTDDTRKLKNCELYNGYKKCTRCKDGYLLKLDRDECVGPVSKSCLIRTESTNVPESKVKEICELCAPGYALNTKTNQCDEYKEKLPANCQGVQITKTIEDNVEKTKI